MGLGDVGFSTKTTPASNPPGTIHSCRICSVQEIDPVMKPRDDEYDGCVVKYRGSRVLYGASKGCAFFQEMITYLEHILKANGYGDGSASACKFQPEGWICKLRFFEPLGILEWATAEWHCAKGELPRINQNLDPIRPIYCLVAYQGMHEDQPIIGDNLRD